MRSVDICGSHCNFTGFGIRHGGYTSQEPYILTGHRHPSISQLCLTGDPSDHDSIIEVFFDQFGLELSPEILATRWSMAADQIVDWFTVSGDNVFMMIIVIDVYCGYVFGWFGCLCFFSWRNGCKSRQQFQQRFISLLPLAFAIAQPGPEQTHPWQNTHCSSKRHCFSRECWLLPFGSSWSAKQLDWRRYFCSPQCPCDRPWSTSFDESLDSFLRQKKRLKPLQILSAPKEWAGFSPLHPQTSWLHGGSYWLPIKFLQLLCWCWSVGIPIYLLGQVSCWWRHIERSLSMLSVCLSPSVTASCGVLRRSL